MATGVGKRIELTFGMSGGGSINAGSGALIKSQLDNLVGQLNNSSATKLTFTVNGLKESNKYTKENVDNARRAEQIKREGLKTQKAEQQLSQQEVKTQKEQQELATKKLQTQQAEVNLKRNQLKLDNQIAANQEKAARKTEQNAARTQNASIQNMRKYVQLANILDKNEVDIRGAGGDLWARGQNLLTSFANGQFSSRDANEQLASYQKALIDAGIIQESFGSRMRNLFKQHFNVAVAMAGIHLLQQGFRELVDAVRETDTAMTELKKVTDETDITYRRFLADAGERSKLLGSTVSDYVNATADFARLGYDLRESSSLAEAATIYKNVGDGIASIGDASESLISTMKAFDVNANDSLTIVDKYNEVGNNFAISSKGIGEVLQRSASALQVAGNTLDESIGLAVAGNTVVDVATYL